MSDVTPTPEQIAAYRDLADPARIFTAGQMALLAPLLPDALTNPQPALPTEPGRYVDHAGNSGWLLCNDQWSHDGKRVVSNQALPFAPFTRLVPERPPVTLLEIARAYQDATNDHMIDDGIEAIATLVNGTPNE